MKAIKPVNELTEEEKYAVWVDYMVHQTAFRHDFYTVDLLNPNALHGYGKPDKVVENTAFFKMYKNWPNTEAWNFERFTDPANQNPPNYHGKLGIYDYYPKFHKRIFPQ